MSNKIAVIPAKFAPIEVKSVEIYKPGKGEILIKNSFVSSNPVEWKLQKYGILIQTYPAGLGSDSAGVVEEIGEGVTRFKKGDRVFAWAHYINNGFDFKSGAFQQYTVADEKTTNLTPANISDEVASTWGLGIVTAFGALYQELKLERPPASKEKVGSKSDQIVWINGGSSAVGSAAVQLAYLSGYKVLSTSSPKNFDLVKSFGASEVFDYNDASLLEKAKQYLNGAIVSYVFDCEPTINTAKAEIELLNGAGALTSAVFLPEGIDTKKTKISATYAGNIIKDPEFLSWTFPWLESALKAGLLIPLRTEVVAHGIEQTQLLLDYHAEGVSAMKPLLKVW